MKPVTMHDWRLRESHLFLALTVVVGVISGLMAVLFALAIDAAHHALLGAEPSAWRALAVPVVVGIGTGLLLSKVFLDVRGSGIPQTKTAYHLHEGVIGPLVPVGKFITGVLCIGSGHSMGREGPSVQIGAGLASTAGRWLRLSPARVRMLVPVGASAALAAAFNTPIAAVLFSLEEIIGDMNAPLLGSTVVASVSAVIVERSILGNAPLFRVPAYQLVHPGELIFYAALGVIGGGVSLVFCKSLLGLRALLRRLPAWTRLWQPAMGGLLIGILIIVLPQVTGVGYEYVDQALNGGMMARTMLLFCGLKIAATVISYASGNAGGIFGPTLYFGAMTGGVVGIVAQRIAPFPVGEPGAYALVGMGALFAGVIRAPMTSVFMMFEVTQDYQILVPLMVANMLSLFISKRYQEEPVYHALLKQDSVHLPHAPPPAHHGWRADQLIVPPAPSFAPDLPIAEALAHLAPAQRGAIVGPADHALGVVTRAQLAKAVDEGRGAEPIERLAGTDWPHAHPDHSLDVVLERLRDSGGVLPVVARTNARHVRGLITEDSIVNKVLR